GGRAWRGAEQGDKGFVLGCDQFGAELQHAAPLFVGLDDLDALPCDRFSPVVSSGFGKELAKSRELVCRALEDLTNQILSQSDVVSRHCEQRFDVARRYRLEEVGQ